MADGSAAALWFGATGFEVLEVGVDGIELTVAVETTATVVGSSRCGTRAVPKVAAPYEDDATRGYA